MTPPEPPSDPGWGGLKGILSALVPIVSQNQTRGADALLTMRRVFLSFCTAIVLILVVLVVIELDDNSNASLSGTAAVAIAVVFGVVALVLIRLYGDRPLDCTNGPSLASSYRTRFFLRLAFAEGAAMLGFVLSFIAATPWPYLAALPFTAIGFAWAAPTRGRLAHDQQRLSSAGCTRDLVAALRGFDT